MRRLFTAAQNGPSKDEQGGGGSPRGGEMGEREPPVVGMRWSPTSSRAVSHVMFILSRRPPGST